RISKGKPVLLIDVSVPVNLLRLGGQRDNRLRPRRHSHGKCERHHQSASDRRMSEIQQPPGDNNCSERSHMLRRREEQPQFPAVATEYMALTRCSYPTSG